VAARNGRSNTYHHAGHFIHVVIAAGLLAHKAGIGHVDRDLLVLAALVHDLDHFGRRSLPYPPHRQERWSARMTGRILMRWGGDPRIVRRLEQLIIATAPTTEISRATNLTSDPLALLLNDADVFASVFYERGLAMKLTGMLKLEQGLSGDVDAMLTRFAARIEREGLYSKAGRTLLRELTLSRQRHRNVVPGKG
jgi:hypothetical protein